MPYTIGHAAKKMGITPYTLRYYDKEGLLPFIERSASGVRTFRDEDMEWLKLIECLKSAGMPIKGIKSFIDWYAQGDSTLRKRRDMFYERKAVVQEQIQALQKTLDRLTYKCWYYDRAVASGTVAVPKAMKPEDMPEEIRQLKQRLDE